MNWIPHFSSGYFAIAGLICAVGPILIHLLNRRRFRQLEWAAMDFLFEAVHDQRRRLQLRDLVLLLLRTLAIVLFGLALARPFLEGNGWSIDAHTPRHLILLIDNSLSMGYRQVDTSLWERAKGEARELIESLPEGSQITVSGTCGGSDDGCGPLRRKPDALELLDTLQIVDGVSRIEDVVGTARAALATAAPLADQIVLLTDLQRHNWPADSTAFLSAQLPPIQIRDVSAEHWENTWVADVRLRDDIVALDAPATVFVTIGHHGTLPRHAQVAVALNEQVIATRSLDLLPGHTERQLAFECSFAETVVEPGAVAFVPLHATITPDRLELDDQRTLMVPVVASLPVIFVDQVAEADEDPTRRRLGETRPLRQLLAPRSPPEGRHPLIEVQHVTINQLSREMLSTARLVVIAGVPDPSGVVDLLTEYVQQGGPLVIATGGGFNPVAWNMAAWRDGNGILPGRLVETPVGTAPQAAVDAVIQPFFLSGEDLLSEPLLRLPGLSDEQLRELYLEPLFFQAIAVEDPATVEQSGKDGSADDAAQHAPPQWLSWKSPLLDTDVPPDTTEAGEPFAPHWRVCARFDNEQNTPFLLAGRVGKGQVLFASTSLLPTWNTLAQSNAIVLWDHLLRTLIRHTLPQRNFMPQRQLAVPMPNRQRGAKVRLQRPPTTRPADVLDVGFIGTDRLGVMIPDAWTRGVYHLQSATADDETNQMELPNWQKTIALNGEARESDLTPLAEEEFRQRVLDTHIGQLLAGNTISAVGSATQGNAWWWLILAVFVLLVAELVLLAATTGALSTRTP